MIKSTLSEKHINCFNHGDVTFDGYYYFADLNSQLTFARGWLNLPPNCSTNLCTAHFPSPVYELGFRLILDNKSGEKVHSQDFPTNDGVAQYYFDCPYNEITYASWHSLMFLKEYEGMFDIQENEIVYDLGANIGAFSKWVDVKYAYKQIYGFEPTPKHIKCLETTFKGQDKIKFFNKAISKNDGVKHFNLFKDSVCNTLVDKPPDSNHVGKTEVECVNLENFVRENDLLAPTFIKMDIEGEEYDALEGMSDRFIQNLRILLLEFHNHDHEDGSDKLFNVIKRMLNLGFKFDIKQGGKLFTPMGTIIFYNKKVN